jgi:hypothetical protein
MERACAASDRTSDQSQYRTGRTPTPLAGTDETTLSSMRGASSGLCLCSMAQSPKGPDPPETACNRPTNCPYTDTVCL